MGKAGAARILSMSGLINGLTYMRTLCIKDIPILAYHRIYDINDESTYFFDPELVSASSEQFDWQMRYIRRRYHAISFGDLALSLAGKKKLKRRSIIVTFDDGYSDNYEIAYPILQQYGLPATVFLSTGYIGTKKVFWFDWVVYMLSHTSNVTLYSQLFDEPIKLNGNVQDRRLAAYKSLAKLKVLPDTDRKVLIAEIESALDIEQPQEGFLHSRALTWSQVKEMAENGIEIGSHTVSHPILSNLNADEMYTELRSSKEEIERHTGEEVNVLSYPVGGKRSFNDKVKSAVRRVGYKLACSYIPGTNMCASLDVFELKRLHIERYVDRAMFTSMIAVPELFGRA